MKLSHRILLYYCYTHIEDPQAFRKTHHLYCIEHHLRGRIIIAQEGINGTISGSAAACERYIQDLKADARFAHVYFKQVDYHQHAFQKLHVRLKPEIVHAGLPHIHPQRQAGTYITAKEFQQMRDQKEDMVLLDVRSNYEHNLGRFKNAITLNIDHFRAFPSQLTKLAPYQHRKVVTYCTGGVKCEKASALLLQNGFQHVYQLHGGIVQYGIETDGKDFEGVCYVFDQRLTVRINKDTPTVIARCHVCQAPCERMINCANAHCNRHIPVCVPCADTLAGACSTACQQHPKKRYYDGTGYYTTKMHGYNPYLGARIA